MKKLYKKPQSNEEREYYIKMLDDLIELKKKNVDKNIDSLLHYAILAAFSLVMYYLFEFPLSILFALISAGFTLFAIIDIIVDLFDIHIANKNIGLCEA